MKSLKGKVVVIDFWATWCGPCVAEMPNMKKLYAEYKDKGVEFVGVSLDKSKEQGGLDKLSKRFKGLPERDRLAPVLSRRLLAEQVLKLVGDQLDPCRLRG